MDDPTQTAPEIDADAEHRAWAEAQAAVDGVRLDSDHVNLADWYVGRMLAFDDERERIKNAHAERLRAIDARQQGLARFLGPKVQEIVRRMLKGKAKSVVLPHGRAGWRDSKGRVVWDSTGAVIMLEQAMDARGTAHRVEQKPVDVIDSNVVRVLIDRYAAAHEGAEPDGVRVEGSGSQFFVRDARGGNAANDPAP